MLTFPKMSLVMLCGLVAAGCAGAQADRAVPPGGGEVRIDEVAAVDVPAGAFDQKTRVSLSRVAAPDAREAFGEAAVLFDVRQPLPYAFHVTTEGGPPKEAVTVEIVVPEEWRRRAQVDPEFDRSVLRVFGRNVWESAGHRLVTLEPLAAGVNPRSRVVRVEVPPQFFSKSISSIDGHAAILRLGLTPAPGAEEAVVIALPSPESVPAPAAGKEAEAQTCRVTLGPPLRGNFHETTPFGTQEVNGARRYHPGIDLAPDPAAGEAGHDVLAMADGVVAGAGTQTDATGHPAGWGQYVILAHGRRGTAPFTVYANLLGGQSPVRLGQRVRRGEVIGRIAPPSESAGHDLHLEFVPGIAPAAVAKADPRACMTGIVIDRMIAGFRSSAIVDAPALETDDQAVDVHGSAADNERWIFATHAAARQPDTGISYVSDVSGAVTTRVNADSMRIELTADGVAGATSIRKNASHPAIAAASGAGGVRTRFHVAGPARYRLTIRYDVSEEAQWRVQTRLDRTGAGTTRSVDEGIKEAAGSGEGPAKFERVYEGSLEEDATYDFDFLPMLVFGGEAGEATLSAHAVLEVNLDGAEAR